MKKRPAIITTPYPTTDELARSLGISKKRQKALEAIVEKSRPKGKKKAASNGPVSRRG